MQPAFKEAKTGLKVDNSSRVLYPYFNYVYLGIAL
jgi:hypothetical protein